MRTELLIIGSELLSGTKWDTNSHLIIRELSRFSLVPHRVTILPDEKDRIIKAFSTAFSDSDLVITTGGLGPTIDDLTVQALSEAFGKPLRMNEEVLAAIEDHFARRGLSMPENNKKQALIPEGAEPLPNRIGTAPGIWLPLEGKVFVLLPGVPAEARMMFLNEVAPRLESLLSRSGELVRRVLRVVSLSESAVDERAKDLLTSSKIECGIIASPGEIEIHLQARGKEEIEELKWLEEELYRRFGDDIFGVDEDTLEAVVGMLLRKEGGTLAVAESCTGGLLGSRITDVPGSSDYFLLGVVAYSNRAKVELLGVSQDLIESYGAVSDEVAKAMALGVRKKGDADYGIGITGIAGPSGGTEEKPVGLVYIGLSTRSKTFARRFVFSGERLRIKRFATQMALDILRRELLKHQD
ncbi:MAG: competence/damage-inducible protein A [Acidobacteria bacterium]|nr:competence/damage-inducible protein A [Acidobacteriota bacterium]